MLTLTKSVSKLSVAHSSRAGDKKIKYLKPVTSESTQTTLKLFSNEGYVFVKYEDIIYCRSMGNYTEVFFEENGAMKSLVVSKTLKTIQAALPPVQFLRCHQSYLFARDQIRLVTKNQTLILLNGTELPISRRMRKALLDTLRLVH